MFSTPDSFELLQNFLMKMLTILFDEFLCLAAGLSCFSSRFGFPVSLHRSDYVSVHLLYVLTDSTAIIRKRSVTFPQ